MEVNWSAGARVLVGEVTVHVFLAKPVRTTDPDGRKLSGLHEPVDGHIGHPQLVRDFSNSDEPTPGLVWLHQAPPFSAPTSVRQCGS